jgi:hypothetical protein
MTSAAKAALVSTLGSGGRGGRGAGFSFGVHNVAVDSKGNVSTAEVFEGSAWRNSRW